MRRMAGLGMLDKAMKSVSGRSKHDEVARDTEADNLERPAKSAIACLVAWETSNLVNAEDKRAAAMG